MTEIKGWADEPLKAICINERRIALDDAAKICEAIMVHKVESDDRYVRAEAQGARLCADAIRQALKSGTPVTNVELLQRSRGLRAE